MTPEQALIDARNKAWEAALSRASDMPMFAWNKSIDVFINELREKGLIE